MHEWTNVSVHTKLVSELCLTSAGRLRDMHVLGMSPGSRQDVDVQVMPALGRLGGSDH